MLPGLGNAIWSHISSLLASAIFHCLTHFVLHSPISCHDLPYCWLPASLFPMSDHSQDVQVSVTPAVKDLRNMFEQKARESPAKAPDGSSRTGDTSLLLGSRPPTSRRPSPTFLDDQTDFLAPSSEPSHPDQSSLRKRPPPPPPSRGQKPQIGSPSPSHSPLLRPTLELVNAPENRSPPPIKQRLVARPPPPVPGQRPDRTIEVEPSFDPKSSVDKSPLGLG